MPQIDQFLELLVRAGGSDLHIGTGNPPVLRVNGKLTRIEYPALTEPQVMLLLSEIMSPEQRTAYGQANDLDFAYQAADLGRFRVNTFRMRTGSAAVFRVVPTKIPTADEIGMPMAVRQLALAHQGLVLITGVTGSGKSTTLAALVNLINMNRRAHILTIEDPIEFIHESKKSLINQREVGQHTESFNRALRAALREDPDVILVGELRDLETISLAVKAAETGHLVLGTLHAMSAHKAIDRVIDSFPAEQQQQIRLQLSEALRCVIAQQLPVKKDGKGRVAAYEVMLNNPAIANLIREGKTHLIRQMMQTGRKEGMQTMDMALADLVRRKLIDPQEALSRAHDRRYLEQELKSEM